MLITGVDKYAVPSQNLKQKQFVRQGRILGARSKGIFLDELGESGALAHIGLVVIIYSNSNHLPRDNNKYFMIA